jgi:hypothetical protein
LVCLSCDEPLQENVVQHAHPYATDTHDAATLQEEIIAEAANMHGTYEWIVSYDEIKHLLSPSFLKTSPSVGRYPQRNPLVPLSDRAVKFHAVRLDCCCAADRVSFLPRNSPPCCAP